MFKAIAAVFTFLFAVLDLIVQRAKKRGKGSYEGDIKEFDTALSKKDVDTLSAKFNELRKPGSSNTGRPNDKET